MFPLERCMFFAGNTKRPFNKKILFSHIKRKNIAVFVIFSKIMLDNLSCPWYIIQARVGNTKAHCDDAGDCVLDGNFRGVCPVIGRLNCF